MDPQADLVRDHDGLTLPLCQRATQCFAVDHLTVAVSRHPRTE
jgi:hypothetical protein